MHRNQKFLDKKVTYKYILRLFGFLIFFLHLLFLLFFCFCCSNWPAAELASRWNISEKASSIWAIFTMEWQKTLLRVFHSNFWAFSCTSWYTSGSIELITLTWASLERSFPPIEFQYRSCLFWSNDVRSGKKGSSPSDIIIFGQHLSQPVTGGTQVKG